MTCATCGFGDAGTCPGDDVCPPTQRTGALPTPIQVPEWSWIWQSWDAERDIDRYVAVVTGGVIFRKTVMNRIERTLYSRANRVDAPFYEWLACDENGVAIVGVAPC